MSTPATDPTTAPETATEKPAQQPEQQFGMTDEQLDAAYAGLEDLTIEAGATAPAEDVTPAPQAGADDAGRQDGTTGTQGEGDKGGSTAPETQSAATPEERERALLAEKALRLDGMEDSDIAALSPERRLALGEKARERQRNSQTAWSDFQRAKRVLADAGMEFQPSQGVGAPASGEAAPPAQTRDRDADTGPSSEASLSEQLEQMAVDYPDQVGVIRDTIKQLTSRYDTLAGEHVNTVVTSTFEQLQPKFPELKEQGNRDAVVARARKWAQDGAEDSLESLLQDACMVQFGSRVLSDATRAEQQRQDDEELGSPLSPVSTQDTATGVALSEEDRDALALQALNERGGHGFGAVQARFAELARRRSTASPG